MNLMSRKSLLNHANQSPESPDDVQRIVGSLDRTWADADVELKELFYINLVPFALNL